MSPWKTAEVPLPCRDIPAGENFFEKKKLGVDIIDSSGYNNQAVFSRGSTICGCAGTGRQASLRCWCPNRRVGSNPVSRTITLLSPPYARVVELADSLDSGSSVHYGRAGSSPASRTTKSHWRRRSPVGPLGVNFISIRASGGIGRLARFRF